MLIIHVLPENADVCGGIKVHYQLAQLEKSLGHSPVIAYPLVEEEPRWFSHSCKVLSWKDAFLMAKAHEDECVVIGRESPSEILPWPAKYKVCYVQGESLMAGSPSDFKDLTMWYSSKWNLSQCTSRGYREGPLVYPFVDPRVFHPGVGEKFRRQHLSVLVQLRKNGKLRWLEMTQHLKKDLLAGLNPVFLSGVSEKEFAQHLRQADILFAHSFPEGFGLPSLEALYSGTLVVGYTGGGGTDFLVDHVNCFLAPDNQPAFAAHSFLEVISMNPIVLDTIVQRGLVAAGGYSAYATRLMLSEALRYTMQHYPPSEDVWDAVL